MSNFVLPEKSVTIEGPFGLSFNVYRGEDGTPVVHVDTDPAHDAPLLRLYVNDGDAVYANPSYPS